MSVMSAMLPSHSVNAFLINNYRDIKSYAKYIHLLLADDSLRSEMAQKGIKMVKDKYSAAQQSTIVDKMISKLDRNYVSL